MGTRNAIVLVVDRLGAGYLGPYGNTWVETPELNRLASQSLLFEFPIADAIDVESVYRSYWLGAHALSEPIDPAEQRRTLPAELRDVRSTLVTDDSRLAALRLADDFGQRIAVAISEAAVAARTAEETRLGQFIAAALDWLSRATHPYLLWLHTGALAGGWDAPPEYRERFRDEDDPAPPTWLHPPDKQLAKEFDPDEVLGVRQAYAGQIALLDTCLGALLDALSEFPATGETLLVLTSPRGLALGEHGAIGACGDRLYGEILHTPLLVRFPDGRHAAERASGLVQPPDLHSLLARWFSEERFERPGDNAAIQSVFETCASHPEIACSVSSGQRSIRTPAWFLRESPSGIELYAKPDDRGEVNEVAQRCSEVVEGLIAKLEEFAAAARAGRLADLPSLPALLCEGWD